MKPRNDRALALSAFCLEIESYRRTPEGRARDEQSFLQFYFSRDGGTPKDRLFSHLPREVRAPIIAGWRVRGLKAALRDDDERVNGVVFDALEAGDVDAAMFESGVTPDVLVDYVPLDEWWQFWRGKTLPNPIVQKALASARAMHLIDDKWFLENIEGRGGKVKGTDAIADTLNKDEVIAWVKALHASGDASPSGIIAARGWDKVLAKTAPEALLFVLDAFARKVHLVKSESSAPDPVAAAAALDGFEDMPQVDLSKLGDDELDDTGHNTPHRPPPLAE